MKALRTLVNYRIASLWKSCDGVSLGSLLTRQKAGTVPCCLQSRPGNLDDPGQEKDMAIKLQVLPWHWPETNFDSPSRGQGHTLRQPDDPLLRPEAGRR